MAVQTSTNPPQAKPEQGTATATEGKPEKAPKPPKPPKFCLSGNGKQVTTNKAKFSVGGDATLKSKLIHEAINGVTDSSIPQAGRDYAAEHWPDLIKKLKDGTHDQIVRAKRRAEEKAKAAAGAPPADAKTK